VAPASLEPSAVGSHGSDPAGPSRKLLAHSESRWDLRRSAARWRKQPKARRCEAAMARPAQASQLIERLPARISIRQRIGRGGQRIDLAWRGAQSDGPAHVWPAEPHEHQFETTGSPAAQGCQRPRPRRLKPAAAADSCVISRVATSPSAWHAPETQLITSKLRTSKLRNGITSACSRAASCSDLGHPGSRCRGAPPAEPRRRFDHRLRTTPCGALHRLELRSRGLRRGAKAAPHRQRRNGAAARDRSRGAASGCRPRTAHAITRSCHERLLATEDLRC